MSDKYVHEPLLDELKASLYSYIRSMKDVARDGLLPFKTADFSMLNHKMDRIHTVSDFHKFLDAEDGLGPTSFLGPHFGLPLVEASSDDAWQEDRRQAIEKAHEALQTAIEASKLAATAELECSNSIVCSVAQKFQF